MSEKDILDLIQLAETKIHEGVSRAEAMDTFVGAGIMDENGEYTPPYRELLKEAGIES